MERVRCGELDGYPTVVGFGSGDRQRCVSDVDAQNRNPSEATYSAFSPVPQPASSTDPVNPSSDANRTIAGCGWPISHGAGPSWYDASQGSRVSRS